LNDAIEHVFSRTWTAAACPRSCALLETGYVDPERRIASIGRRQPAAEIRGQRHRQTIDHLVERTGPADVLRERGLARFGVDDAPRGCDGVHGVGEMQAVERMQPQVAHDEIEALHRKLTSRRFELPVEI